jgi:hypothetical protein
MPVSVGAVNKQYVSSTAFLDQREILNKILDITNEEMSFLDVMELTGRSSATSVPVYRHFVNEELYALATVQTAIATPALQHTIAIAGSGDTTAAINVGELVMFPNGVVGIVTAKTTTSITVRSVDTTVLPALTANQILSFFSNANGEGSLSPASKRWQQQPYFNQVQIFKAKYEITDIQKASKVEVEFQGKPYIMYKGQHESLMKFRADISNSLLFGRISDTTFDSQSPAWQLGGQTVQTTRGLDQYTADGIRNNLGAATTITTAELQTLTQTMNRERCPQDYLLFVGTSMNIAFDNYLNALGSGSVVSQAARFDISGKNLDLGIDSVKIYGRTWHKKYLPILDHKNVVNYTGSHNFKNAAYGVPTDKVKTNDGQMLDRISVRYMEEGGQDTKYREILLGGLAPVPTNEKSVLEIHYSSIQGLDVLGAAHLVKIA